MAEPLVESSSGMGEGSSAMGAFNWYPQLEHAMLCDFDNSEAIGLLSKKCGNISYK